MAFKCKINKDNFMSKFHNEAPSVAKMVSPGSGYFDKTEPKKTSYADAYKKRDMKTYGDLSLEEYTAEAKRQNKSKKETGKWDAPKKPMKSSTKKEEVKEATPEVKKSQVKEVVEKKPEPTKKQKVVEAKDNLKTFRASSKSKVIDSSTILMTANIAPYEIKLITKSLRMLKIRVKYIVYQQIVLLRTTLRAKESLLIII